MKYESYPKLAKIDAFGQKYASVTTLTEYSDGRNLFYLIGIIVSNCSPIFFFRKNSP